MSHRLKKISLRLLISFFFIHVAQFVAAEDAVEPTASPTDNQWEMAGFTESSQKISQHPAYRPLKRVLVGSATPAILEAMSSALPEVEFISSSQAANSSNDYDALFLRCSQSDLLNRAINVAWVQTYSAGVDACMEQDSLQKLIAREGGVILTNSSGTAASVIGEHSIAMMMSMSRGLHRYRDAQAKASWERRLSSEEGLMNTIGGKTMLVLGLGSIGTEVAKRANALGMRVIATRNSSRTGPDYVEYVGLTDETLELASQADVIVNALPLTDSTKGFIDSDFFDTMRPNALYISVGRGGTTNTDALLKVLQNKSISGAALDVTDPEPLPADHPLWKQDNVIITPHISGTGGEARDKTLSLMLENLRRYQAGEALLNVVDTSRGY